jgi:hypothetical protein
LTPSSKLISEAEEATAAAAAAAGGEGMAPSTQGIPLGQEIAYKIAGDALKAMQGDRGPKAVRAKIKRRPHPASNGRCYTGKDLIIDHALYIHDLVCEDAKVFTACAKSILAWAEGLAKCAEARAELAKSDSKGLLNLKCPLLTALLRWECGVEKPAKLKEHLQAQIAPFAEKIAQPPVYPVWKPAEATKK